MDFKEADFPEPPQKDSLHGASFFDEAAFFVEQLRRLLSAGGIEDDFLVRVDGAEIDGGVDEARSDATPPMGRVYEPGEGEKQ